MATLDSFREAAGEPIQLDLANGYIADVRLNSGDVNGRTITVELTDNGTPITTTDGITCALAYNTSPGSDLGDRVTMNAVSGAATATFRAAVPRKALAKPGRILLGIEISSGGNKVCSRNFYGLVERSVFDATSPDADDKLGRIEQLILDADKAIIRINKAVSDARITGGNTTTLDPNQPATSSLRGSGLQRVLDLSIPRGAGVTSAGATTLDPNKPATASMLQAGSKGDYTLLVGVPRGSRIIGVAARTLATGEDATVTATRDAAGDTTLAFGLPRGAKGDKGDPGDAGQVATATVAGVVKPGDNLTVRADGTLDAAAAQYELPVASDTTLGGVKVSKVDYTDARTFPVVVCDGEKLGLSFKLGDNAMPDGIEFHGTENTTIGLKKATSTALGIVRGGGKGIHVAGDGTLNLDLPVATAGAIGGVKPDGKTITAAADGTITAVAQTGQVEYRELVGYGNAAQGYAVRVSDRTWLCCFNSFAMQTDGTTRLPYFYAFLRQAGSSSLTALVANPFDTNGITLLSTDGEQMRFSYDVGGRWAGVRAVSGLDAATLILTEA